MSNWVAVAQVGELPEGGRQVVEVGERMLALFLIEGQYYAIDDLCTHDGGPLIDGHLRGHEIACPRHGAKFDVRDGRALCMPATRGTPAHEVKVEAGQVWVRLQPGTD